MKKENVCSNCKYFDVCGDSDRTKPCKGKCLDSTKNVVQKFNDMLEAACDLCGHRYWAEYNEGEGTIIVFNTFNGNKHVINTEDFTHSGMIAEMWSAVFSMSM